MKARLWAAMIAALCTALLVIVAGASAIGSSTFESADGNVVGNGGKDWQSNPPNLSASNDLATGQGDNSFGQGTSEGDVNVTVVSGSIPNSKADLGRFAVAGETIGADSYLYLAWVRLNDSGSTNFDFEINAQAQPDLTTPGPKTLVRSTGDLLIGYSYQGNSLTPTINLRTWQANGTWTNPVDLTSNGCADGAGNATAITENINNLGSFSRPQGRFGETGINLTCAGVVSAGSCNAFSSAYVKSRSSQSFSSEVKDFISPVHLSLSNCGALKISKDSIKTGDQPLDATFSVTGPNSYSNSLSTGSDGVVCVAGLVPGSYSITETAGPSGYAIDNDDPVSYTVVGNTDCDSASLVTAAFTDTPLTDVQIKVDSQATGGTQSSVDCDNDALDAALAEHVNVTSTGEEPQTIVCTIVIDP